MKFYKLKKGVTLNVDGKLYTDKHTIGEHLLNKYPIFKKYVELNIKSQSESKEVKDEVVPEEKPVDEKKETPAEKTTSKKKTSSKKK